MSIGADPSVGRAMAATGHNQYGSGSPDTVPVESDNSESIIITNPMTTFENQNDRKSGKILVATGLSQSDISPKTNIKFHKFKSWNTNNKRFIRAVKETPSDVYFNHYDELNKVKLNQKIVDDVYKQIKHFPGYIVN